MAPLVVIDLSDRTSPQAVESVVRACSAAIAFGACVAEGTDLPEPPLAVAIVRVGAGTGDLVRIEMGRRDQQLTSWRVRELRFHAGDPAAERWRAVGLAIATLFGEALPQGATPDSGSADSPAEPGGALTGVERPSAEPVATGSTPAASVGSETRPPAVRPARSGAAEVAREATEPGLQDALTPSPAAVTPQPSTGAFIGLGITAGPALSDFGLRWGGSARAGWIWSEGWLLAVSGSYSRHRDSQALAVAWLHLAAAVGRRFELGPVWGAACSVGGGARDIGLEAEREGITEHSRRWNPFATASGELWRHLGGGLALWAALDFNALAAQSRLFVSGTERFVLPRIDAVGSLGLRWMP